MVCSPKDGSHPSIKWVTRLWLNSREFDSRPLQYRGISTWTTDRLQAGIPPRYVTNHPGQLSLLPYVGWEMSTGQKCGDVLWISVWVAGKTNCVIPRAHIDTATIRWVSMFQPQHPASQPISSQRVNKVCLLSLASTLVKQRSQSVSKPAALL